MTQAFPLQWPHGRQRTTRRVKSSFKVTPRKAFEELLEELQRFGAASPVVSSNAPLRRDGTPYADALDDPLPDPGVAVYFTRKNRLVCLACDTYELPYENIRALGLSVKSLRDMGRWGSGQVLDQAFEGFTALPAPDSTSDAPWWVVLDVDAGASVDAIRAAYKAKARKAGGTSVELNTARDAGLKARDVA